MDYGRLRRIVHELVSRMDGRRAVLVSFETKPLRGGISTDGVTSLFVAYLDAAGRLLVVNHERDAERRRGYGELIQKSGCVSRMSPGRWERIGEERGRLGKRIVIRSVRHEGRMDRKA
jgi:hypothetical protein